MNILPIFEVFQQSPTLVAAVGQRVFEDVAPDKTEFPYVVWTSLGGEPDNTLADPPVVDSLSFQLMVYDTQATRASETRKLIAGVLESRCYVTRIAPNYSSRRADTDIFGRGFDGNWWMQRN